MSDNFDPCECVCTTEWAMRRLLSMLRTSQQYCNDNECFNELPGTSHSPNSDNGMFFIFMMWMVVVLILFLYRPASMQKPFGPEKNDRNGHGDHQPPPSVPPTQ